MQEILLRQISTQSKKEKCTQKHRDLTFLMKSQRTNKKILKLATLKKQMTLTIPHQTKSKIKETKNNFEDFKEAILKLK